MSYRSCRFWFLSGEKLESSIRFSEFYMISEHSSIGIAGSFF